MTVDVAVCTSVTVRGVTMLRSGVYAEGGTATVERSRFPDGGGVSAFYGRARVSDSFFNGGGVSGGIAYEVSLTRSVIRNNADTLMDCSEANCSIVNSLLENNKTVFRGWDSAMAMRGNVFRNNGTVYESRTAFGQADTTPDPVERNNPQR